MLRFLYRILRFLYRMLRFLGRFLHRLLTDDQRVRNDRRGEALPAAILFLGVFFTILIAVHVVLIGMARTAVQGAADAAVAAAQAAGQGARESEGILAAQIAMAAASSSILETRTPAVVVEPERGSVTVLVFGGTITPVFGGIELTAQACGPLDDVPASVLTAADAWQC